MTFEKIDVSIFRKVQLKEWLEQYELYQFAQTIVNRLLDLRALEENLNSFRPPNKFTYQHKTYMVNPVAIAETFSLRKPLKNYGVITTTINEFMNEHFKKKC